jgi:hypothetical protein
MATHFDTNKPRMELLPASALTEWARAMTFGARKYGDHNWRKGMAWTRVLGSLSRHLTAFMAGENQDAESGVNHMAHVMCNAAFLLHYCQHHPEFDDRYKSPEPLLEPLPESLSEVFGEPFEELRKVLFVEPTEGIYIGPKEQFLFTYNQAEYYAAQQPNHWVKHYFPQTPLYLLYNGEELATILEIYLEI